MQGYYRAGLLAIAAIVLMLGFSTNSQAQIFYRDSYGYSGGTDPAVYNGYQLGYGAGSNDRAYGRGYALNEHKEFRDADSGYRNSGYGSKSAYEQTFRNAFVQGYRDGFQGAPRQVYYSGDYYNNGGTYNRHVRERYYYPRHRNRTRVYITPAWPY